jgi:hypothetical protein
MIRKSLFWGLTLVLVIALVSLIIRGRQIEKRQSEKSVETVKQSLSSPTKVLHPDDLQVVNSAMQREDRGSVLHEIQIHNSGSVPYSGIYLSFVYLNQAGTVVLAKTQPLNNVSILPEKDYSATNVQVEGVPSAAVRFQISVLSADVATQDIPGETAGS